MATNQSLAELQAVLDRHRSNEAMYKEKVKEINLTRGKIADQLEILQQAYDKKVKGLEQRLEQLKTQNDGLIRENALCKSEIETYQSRLLEKEKIIAMLLNQRKDLPMVGSEKSKSDKTDSLNANQEENKAFKKQGAVFREDYEHVEKIREESSGEKEKSIPEARVERQPERQVEKPVERQVEKQVEKQVQKQVQKQVEVRKAVPPPKRVIPAQPVEQPQPVHSPPKAVEAIQPIVQQQQNQPESQPEPVAVQTRPPPPPKQKAKPAKKNPPPVFQVRRYETNQHEAQEPQFQASDFFKNLGNPSREQPKQPQIHSHQETNHPLQTQEYVQQQQLVQNEPHQRLQQQNHFQQEQQQPLAVQQQHYQQPQEQPQPQPVQPQNNFLPNNYSENFYEPYHPTKKGNNKRKLRPDITHHNQPQVSGSDFFNQLSKAEHQPHHSLDIQQSSIDHIDRDNSLLSNEQPYFADHDPQEVSKPKKAAVKMPKKKMKRDKIKMMDPSCFQ